MIIYGWRRRVHDLAIATYVCGRCGNPTAHALRRAVTKVTLFFIPLFPVSSKYFTVCTFCGATNKLTKEEAQQAQATAAQTPAPPQQPPMPQSPAHQPPAGHPPQQ